MEAKAFEPKGRSNHDPARDPGEADSPIWVPISGAMVCFEREITISRDTRWTTVGKQKNASPRMISSTAGKILTSNQSAGLDLASSPNETVKYNFSPTSWADSAGKEIVDNFVNDPFPGDSYELHGYDAPVSRGKKISPKYPVSKLILAKQKQTRKEKFQK